MGYLGIDIGGSKVALRAEREHGEVLYQTVYRWPRSGGSEADLRALAEHLGALREGGQGPIEAAGVAMPGTVDRAGRIVAWPGRPAWVGLNLREVLSSLLPGARISWADDGDLAALAEAIEAGDPNVIYLGVGTGVGGGIVLDGRLRPGPDRGSCEIGHMIVQRDGPVCDCGRRGCLQALASGPATLRRASAALGRPVTFGALQMALRRQRPWAAAAVAESCSALAVAVVSLSELVRPSLAVIGGGFAIGMPGMVARISEGVAALSRPGYLVPEVRAAALEGLSSLRGAMLLARDPAPGLSARNTSRPGTPAEIQGDVWGGQEEPAAYPE
jgi:kanosamine 6-kinase